MALYKKLSNVGRKENLCERTCLMEKITCVKPKLSKKVRRQTVEEIAHVF